MEALTFFIGMIKKLKKAALAWPTLRSTSFCAAVHLNMISKDSYKNLKGR